MNKTAFLFPLSITVLISGCLRPPVETPINRVTQTTPITVNQNELNQADILFMVDNSSSMSAMQSQLQARFATFLQAFEDQAANKIYADLHIAVVTSDYGAGNQSNISSAGGCEASPGGQKGLFQVLPAASAGVTGCSAPVGAPYIEYSFKPGAANNLPGTKDVADLNHTFTCMASVGATGCGYEHQLESVYAGLQQTSAFSTAALNGDFLRPDALLAVVFVTNEDDGSAPPTTNIYRSDPTSSTTYGYYDTYRQTRWGIDCKQGGSYLPPPYPASFTPGGGSYLPVILSNDGCEAAPSPAPDGSTDVREYDIRRYIDFFQSIKTNPKDVILVGLDGPTTPYEIIGAIQSSGLGAPPDAAYTPCSPIAPNIASPDTSCVVRLQHSCQNQKAPAFFADPPVRLSAVIHNGATTGDEEPICGSDPVNSAPDYTQALINVAALITNDLAPGCIPAPLPDLAQPDCSVQDVSGTGATQTITAIPECNSGEDMGSPTFNGGLPCWLVQANTLCNKASPQGVGMTIYRQGSAPPMTHAQVSCETIASGT